MDSVLCVKVKEVKDIFVKSVRKFNKKGLLCGNPVLFIGKDISFNPQRYIFEKPFLYL